VDRIVRIEADAVDDLVDGPVVERIRIGDFPKAPVQVVAFSAGFVECHAVTISAVDAPEIEGFSKHG
jgi:uncharacterized protein YunC (DUF1805 family)